MKLLALSTLLVMLTVSAMGCETIKGAGKDIQNTGDNVWDVLTNK